MTGEMLEGLRLEVHTAVWPYGGVPSVVDVSMFFLCRP